VAGIVPVSKAWTLSFCHLNYPQLEGRPGQAVTRGECSNRLETTAIGAAWRADAPTFTQTTKAAPNPSQQCSVAD
jgi:hypothetical protein